MDDKLRISTEIVNFAYKTPDKAAVCGHFRQQNSAFASESRIKER